MAKYIIIMCLIEKLKIENSIVLAVHLHMQGRYQLFFNIITGLPLLTKLTLSSQISNVHV